MNERDQGTQAKSGNKLDLMELAGPQMDGNQLRRFLAGLAGKVGVTLVLACLGIMIWFFLPAGSAHRNMFEDVGTYRDSPHRGKVFLRVEDYQRQNSVKLMLFKREPRQEHTWLVLEIYVKNNHKEEKFRLNRSAFGLRTAGGESYMPHHHTRLLHNGFKTTTLSPGEEIRKNLLFEVPSTQTVESLLIRDPSGPIASTKF